MTEVERLCTPGVVVQLLSTPSSCSNDTKYVIHSVENKDGDSDDDVDLCLVQDSQNLFRNPFTRNILNAIQNIVVENKGFQYIPQFYGMFNTSECDGTLEVLSGDELPIDSNWFVQKASDTVFCIRDNIKLWTACPWMMDPLYRLLAILVLQTASLYKRGYFMKTIDLAAMASSSPRNFNLQWKEQTYYVENLVGLPLYQYSFFFQNVKPVQENDFGIVLNQSIQILEQHNPLKIRYESLQTVRNVDELIDISFNMLWAFGGSFPYMDFDPTIVL